MVIQPIDYFLVVWFALALLSTAYVAWDRSRRRQSGQATPEQPGQPPAG